MKNDLTPNDGLTPNGEITQNNKTNLKGVAIHVGEDKLFDTLFFNSGSYDQYTHPNYQKLKKNSFPNSQNNSYIFIGHGGFRDNICYYGDAKNKKLQYDAQTFADGLIEKGLPKDTEAIILLGCNIGLKNAERKSFIEDVENYLKENGYQNIQVKGYLYDDKENKYIEMRQATPGYQQIIPENEKNESFSFKISMIKAYSSHNAEDLERRKNLEREISECKKKLKNIENPLNKISENNISIAAIRDELSENPPQEAQNQASETQNSSLTRRSRKLDTTKHINEIEKIKSNLIEALELNNREDIINFSEEYYNLVVENKKKFSPEMYIKIVEEHLEIAIPVHECLKKLSEEEEDQLRVRLADAREEHKELTREIIDEFNSFDSLLMHIENDYVRCLKPQQQRQIPSNNDRLLSTVAKSERKTDTIGNEVEKSEENGQIYTSEPTNGLR